MIDVLLLLVLLICLTLTLSWFLITDNVKMPYTIHDLISVQILFIFAEFFWRNTCCFSWASYCICCFASLHSSSNITSCAELSVWWTHFPLEVSASLSICLSVSVPKPHCYEFTFHLFLQFTFQTCLSVFQLLWGFILVFKIIIRHVYFFFLVLRWLEKIGRFHFILLVFFLFFWIWIDWYQNSLFSVVLLNLMIVFCQELSNFIYKFTQRLVHLTHFSFRNFCPHRFLSKIDSISEHFTREIFIKVCVCSLGVLCSRIIWYVLCAHRLC